jgi:transposase-like protein
LIPRFDGAILLLEWKEAAWDKFVTERHTTHAVRAAIQRSQASLATLSRELGINPKTVAKWRKRATVEDLKTGPKAPHSTTLTKAEEAIVVAFRRHTLPPLDDCLYALQPSIPHLTRSALHRCLQRHGISRLPNV